MNQTDYGMPIYNLQHMLRTVFQVRGMEIEVIPDGYFGETTQEAVKTFQRMQNLTPNGTVNQQTWDLLVREYDLAVIDGKDPICVQLFVREDFMKESGGPLARIAVMQAMLQVMQKRFSNLPQVEVTGVRDAQTEAAIQTYRKLFGLSETGGLDNQLWYHFAKAYESGVLPYDFENPKNNRFNPELSRQQVDTSVRSAKSMPDMMADETPSLRQPTDADLKADTDKAINLMPTLDSYKSLNQKTESAESEAQILPGAREQGSALNQTRPMRSPLKWNFK